MNNILEVKILPTGNGKSRETTESKFYQTMYSFPDQQLNWKKHGLCQRTDFRSNPSSANWQLRGIKQGSCAIFFFLHLHWSIIALQWCISFCCITKWISYMYTYIPTSPPSFFFIPLYWSIIALHCCVSCCCITKWISYTYTYIPICPPSCVSLPPSLSHPSRWSQSTELISLCNVAASH